MAKSNKKPIAGLVLTLALLGAMMFAIAPAALATGSHSANYSHVICSFTGSHANSGGRAMATTQYSDSDCNKSSLRLKYQFGGDTVWTPTYYWYSFQATYGLNPSTTIQSRHQARYGSSWSSIKNLY